MEVDHLRRRGRKFTDEVCGNAPITMRSPSCTGSRTCVIRPTPAVSNPTSDPAPDQTQLPALSLSKWFAEQVHPHDSSLKAYLRGTFPSVRDIDDVVQESYFRIWKARAAQPIQSARAFLFKVARHVALDLVRRNQSSRVDAVGDLGGLPVIEEGPDAAEAYSFQEKVDVLAEAIAALPEGRREIVVLCKLRRLPQKEVAARLGLSERTVENQLFRGIKRCRAFLNDRGIKSLFGDEK